MSWRYRKKDTNASPSKRWTTTCHSAMEEVNDAITKNPPSISQMHKDLTTRKLANTKTSICFGNESVVYISDAMENQRKGGAIASKEDRDATTERIRKMKADLTTTNFCLGDETPVYASVNRDAMAAAETFKGCGRVQMNSELKEAVKKSSLHFGNETVHYESVAHEGMKYKGNENNFAKLKQEVADMTATLRKHNFSFGEEKIKYETDNMRGYGSVPLAAYRERMENSSKMRAIIEDTRSCHYSLGQDKIKYSTNTRDALETIKGHAPADVSAQLERAKEMKAALQKTSIVIGDDADYM